MCMLVDRCYTEDSTLVIWLLDMLYHLLIQLLKLLQIWSTPGIIAANINYYTRKAFHIIYFYLTDNMAYPSTWNTILDYIGF